VATKRGERVLAAQAAARQNGVILTGTVRCRLLAGGDADNGKYKKF